VEKLPPFDEILVNICGYELPTNLQNVTQKYLTEVKIFQKVFKGGLLFSEASCSFHFVTTI